MSKYTVIVVVTCFLFFIFYQFYNAYKIDKNGVIVKVKIDYVNFISSNEGGSSNISFILLANINGKDKVLEGYDTVPTFYSSQLMAGEYIEIKYIDEKNYSFIFKNEKKN
ncbi:hypothetical protein F6Q07_11620 [Pectobacterium parmentieri]|uniref:Uncharacterized protein n=2 Tax=Pectobacterium parmentieri TaxID=1905730 RepID=A0A0H3I7Z9_PECPM|nr:hypothetical protein [Pectobacterium parmentieri]ACX87794.1 conserved hypothetical protein [Pectobacterium parmentieri WPP163]AFI90051.1 Hypothetical protein W5S_1961 [Pectobacterium parmentieri]AOR59000.1 hypothetical protein A8F97_08770 [Pectobacterium parmentieri]AYH01255.1 hypothetical protein C5E26_10095 [Pectobacterium parmentieri]AYH09971.1 hypothetical protein C5E24_09900 [Pectobacterium parmentieri]